ncbi:gas vesicle protein [Streptomyces sp. INA 01156]
MDDLLEVLLNKGAVLHLDLIVAVADIPLIGVSLRAAVAGMETMLEHGMMRHWDEDTRAWAERSVARRALELEEGESVVCRMSGGHLLTEGLCHGWRPGTVHLTDRRLVVLRDEPREILWQTGLDAVTAVRLAPERTVGARNGCAWTSPWPTAVRSASRPGSPENCTPCSPRRARAARWPPSRSLPPSRRSRPSPRGTCGTTNRAGRAVVARWSGTADRRQADLEVPRGFPAGARAVHGGHHRGAAAARVQPCRGGRRPRGAHHHGRRGAAGRGRSGGLDKTAARDGDGARGGERMSERARQQEEGEPTCR